MGSEHQMLLEREALPVYEAVERLASPQVQVPSPPYVGLWTRLRDFRRDELTRLLESGWSTGRRSCTQPPTS